MLLCQHLESILSSKNVTSEMLTSSNNRAPNSHGIVTLDMILELSPFSSHKHHCVWASPRKECGTTILHVILKFSKNKENIHHRPEKATYVHNSSSSMVEGRKSGV